MPNKLSQFWQELKRRKVMRVVTVYAGAAFVIIELIINITEPLHLPEWTPTLVIVLLAIGFPIVIIFSWIYDISPKGIIKTAKDAYKGRSTPIANSIAVLPFQDMSKEKDQEYFCDGIAEEIINALAHVSGLKVIARTSAFAFKNQNLDIREIGEKLNVETLLEGSIRKDSQRLRITVQLIMAKDGLHIWSERFDSNLEDIFAIQEEISLAIVDNLKIELLGEEKAAVLKRYTNDFGVYNLYLKALSNIQMATHEGFEKAMEYIGQALKMDPLFVPGYHGLAEVCILSSFFGKMMPNTAYPKAKEYAKKILEIDNKFIDAHRILGLVSMYYDWDWKAAELHLKYALKLNPNGAWIHHSFSMFLSLMRSHEESIVEAKRAVELDPLSGYFRAVLGSKYIYARQFEEAIVYLKQTTATFPNQYFGHMILGNAYQCVLKMDEAIKEYRTAMELANEVPITIGFLALILYETGDQEEADRLVKMLIRKSEREYVPAIIFAIYYLRKGAHEYAIKYLEQSLRDHDGWLLFNMVWPIEELRIPNEPRYVELMNKAGLKQYFQND